MTQITDLFTMVFFWAVGLFTIPTIAYLAQRRRTRFVWPARTVTEPLLLAAADPYRLPGQPILATRVVSREGTPPLVVRLAAFTSFFLGQMFVPGLLCALIGVMVYGIGLLGIPGLYLAWRVFGLGSGLLARDPAAVKRAGDMARLSYILNGVVVLVGLGFMTVSPEFGFFLLGYAAVSIFHGVLLQQAAAAVRAMEHQEDAPDAAAAPALT